MKKSITFVLLAFICICGFSQAIDPVLLEEMGRRTDDEKIKVVVIMKSQYDRQQLGRRAAHYVTRADRREFVVNELKQFAEASQYELRSTLSEMERQDMTTAPRVIWMANALYFSATKQAVNDLAMRSDIAIIGFDQKRHALFNEEPKPANTPRGLASNVSQVNANQVWNLGYTGQGVVVAVIDTGVNYNHLDLADHLWDGGSEFPHHGYDFVNYDNDPMDDYGHGTHCAGTVCGDGTAGIQTGMAPDATLMCLKVLDSEGNGEVSITCEAMQWAVEHGCDLFSMSLGWANSSITERTMFRNTCAAVLDAGVIGAIAAGNEGYDQWYFPIPNNVRVPGSCPPPYLDPIQANNPGALSCAVCVGAVDEYDYAAWFTSQGPVTWSNTVFADYPYSEGSSTEFGLIRPDVCAPGVNVISADYLGNSSYVYMDGTSMATPCVAGCMSLLLSKNINATPAEICQILEETAYPLETGKSNTYGYGRVDVLAAINVLNSGPLSIESFAVNDGQGNNDGNLNAGESVTLDLTLLNDSDVALDGATVVLSTESEYVTITDGSATLPHFNAGQTQTIDDIFAFTLSDNALGKRTVQFSVEAFADGESLGIMRLSVMVYGPVFNFVEVTVLNDNNSNNSLEAGETANLHVTISNIGNDIATSVVGTLSTAYPYLVINSNGKSFGDMEVDGQASADFNVSLSNAAPDGYTIDFSLDLVDGNAMHREVEFELWRKAITLTSNPEGAGTLTGAGYYGEGQNCSISATANEGYVFSKWTKDGSQVSCFPNYSFNVTNEAEYVANFREVDGIVIGDAVSASTYLPTNFAYSKSLTQQIFTAAEMGGQPCEISSVSFFNTSSYRYRNLSVYLVHTNKTSFDSNSDWINVTEDDMVYSGSISMTSYGWANIYFSTPFNYDGSSNVALIVDDNSNSYYSSNLGCRTFNTSESQAIYVCGSTNYDPYNPSDYTGTLLTEKNQVVFGYARYIYTVNATANPEEGGTVSGGGDLYYYGQPISLSATPNPGYVFNSWKKNNSVVSCLSPYNFTVTASADYVASFKEVDGIAIGEPTYTNYYLPSYTYYPYSLTQQIYTADELNTEACEISSVSFFNTEYGETRNLTIFMVNTDKAAFDSENDWITVTEANQVFSGNITTSYCNWSTIYFNTPFLYDGSSNVALVVYDKTNEWGGNTCCRTFETESTQAIYYYSDYYNIDPYEVYSSGTLLSVKNQVIFGIPSYDYTLSLLADPEEGGTVSGGGGLYYYGQPVPVNATPNPGYVFNYWSRYHEDYGYGYDEVVSCFSPDNLPVMGDAEYVAHFQQMDGLVVGEPAHASVYLPTYSDYQYALSQQIYTAGEMNIGNNEISSVSFFNAGYYTPRNLTIFMVNTDKTVFENEYDWIAVSEYDQVFNGYVEFNEYGWTTIYFNTPFVYDGYSNVALIINDVTGDWGWGMRCRTFDTEDFQSIYTYVDDYYYYGEEIIDPYYPYYYGTLLSEKNQVVFGIPTYEFTVSVSASPAEGGTVSGGGGPYYYGQPITISATPNPGYVFNYWEKYYDEWYYDVVSYLSTDNVPVTESADYVAYFQQMDGIIIGDASHTNYYLPSCSSYPYSMSQQIYTADEMNTEACEISSVSFFNAEYSEARNVDIFMVNTSKTYFNYGADWITVTEADLVFSGNVSISNGWTTIYFSTPFNYDGSSNVALVINDKTGDWGYDSYCRTFDTDGDQAIYVLGYDDYYGYENIIDPYHPTNYYGTLLSEKNQVVFGIPSYDYTVTVSANPEEGGTVSGGGGLYYYGQPVTISATANEGYVFNKWTLDGETVSYYSTDEVAVMGDAEYVAQFQQYDGIAIGDAVSSSYYLPSYYYYSLSQQIYTAEEMGVDACEISSVSFFNTGYGTSRNLTIYMANTDKTTFGSNTDWIPVTEANQVFNGNVTLSSYGWTTIYFSTPFAYDGVSNVALIVDNNSGNSSSVSLRTFSTEGNRSIRVYSYSTNYDPCNPSSYSGTLMSERNQVIFGIPSYDYTVTLSANPEEGGTVTGGGDLYYYGQPITVSATANPGYVFNNWTKNNATVSYFSTDQVSVTESSEFVANFQQYDGIAIGDAVSSNSYLPTYSYYYAMTQQIFTAEEMGGEAHEISSVSFFNTTAARTRNLNIYLVNTDKTSFGSNTDWITVTEEDLVFSGSVTLTGYSWATIYFATPFNYDGSSNVALIVDDNTGNSYTGLKCRTFGTNESQAIRIYSYNINYDPYNPSGYSGTLLSEKNQVIFGFPEYGYSVTATANPEEGGTVSGGNDSCYYGQPITLTATANDGYEFNNWTKNGTVVSYLSTYNLSVTETAEYVANFQEVNGFVVGEATGTYAYLPSYSYYRYTLSQQIYTPDELGMGAERISSVAFFNTGTTKTRNYNIYMVKTNKTSFDSQTDWITVTEADQVFSGSVTMATSCWTTIPFDTVFNYDGVSNIALIVDDNTGSWTSSSMSCRAFPTVSNQSLYVYSDGTNYNPYSPTNYYGTRPLMKNQIVLGTLYDITVAANPTGGGLVMGEGTYQIGSNCTVTAEPFDGYIFLNWTENGEVVSNDPTYTFKVSSNRDLVANFDEFTYHWTPAGSYEFNMTLNGIILINGVEQAVPTLEVGAFCGEECRGKGRAMFFPPTGQYVVAMTVGGKRERGEVITFRLYDHVAQQELDLMSIHTLTFENNVNLGTIGDWYPFAFGTIVQQVQALESGWSWWSSYIEQGNIDGLTMLENSLGNSGIIIKSQESHVQNYFGSLGQSYWFGNLTEQGLQNEKSYLKRDLYIHVHGSLFTIAKLWKQPKSQRHC